MLQFNFMHIDTHSKKPKIQSVTHVFLFFLEGKSMIRPIEKLCFQFRKLSRNSLLINFYLLKVVR